MSFPTIPNSLVSGNTFIASDANENFDAIENGVGDGTTDIEVNDISCLNSCNVSAGASVETASVVGTLSVLSDVTFISDVNFNGTSNTRRLGFGAYEQGSISSNVMIPTQSYVAINNIGTGILRRIAKDNFALESIIILTLYPGSSRIDVYPFFANDGNNIGLQLEANPTRITSVHDKLVMQLSINAYTGVYAWQQVSFQNNA